MTATYAVSVADRRTGTQTTLRVPAISADDARSRVSEQGWEYLDASEIDGTRRADTPDARMRRAVCWGVVSGLAIFSAIVLGIIILAASVS